MNSLKLDSATIEQLRSKRIGPRIRIMRESLKREFGNKFSGNSVANRLRNVSQTKLTFIERDKTPNITAYLLYDIAKDFGAPFETFFDDFYRKSNPEITLKPAIFTDHFDVWANQPTEDDQGNRANPLDEEEFQINVLIRVMASNDDYQYVLNRRTDEKHDDRALLELITSTIQQMDLLDVWNTASKDKVLSHVNPLVIATELIKRRKESLDVFPWFPHEGETEKHNNDFENAIQFTKKLQLKNESGDEKRD